MFFRSMVIFKFPLAFATSLTTMAADEGDTGLNNVLAQARIKPVGPLEMSSTGFVPPMGETDEALFFKSEHFIWISVQTQKKIMPPSAINTVFKARLADLEEKEGRKIGGKARKRLKDDVMHEMLPRAFVTEGRTDAYLDLQRGMIVVDASSRKSAEAVVSALRGALGSFPATPVNAEVAPRSVLTGWVAGEPLPELFALADECELKDPIDGGAVARFSKQELGEEEVKKNLEAGKMATKVGFIHEDHVSFVLGEDLIVRKIKLLDGAVDSLENDSREDLRAELNARFTLMTAEFSRLIDTVSSALKFSAVE
ncbi:recombination-associated protein RdgC [Xanthomonas arboricola]|uniref:Recombination-associated protein RdgC n=1 Tax=Xanthomonas arboricola TaxID=56448 RepID=A0AB73H2W9_9XANT|nr:recombination-associated protein RdgC [Xanthomonas arboricola]MBB5672490.1 recombination associated protein RdgC [Xanthomonas arboricola]